MVNLTKEHRLLKEESLKLNTPYAVDFIKQKIRDATVHEKNTGVTFRFSEFANYIVANSPEYKQMWKATGNLDYNMPPISRSYFINTYRTRLQHLLERLIMKKYVSLIDTVTSRRNPEVSTRLYKIDVWDLKE